MLREISVLTKTVGTGDVHTRRAGHVKYGGVSTYIVLMLTLIVTNAVALDYQK
jgi:hypothetical protein